MSSELEDDYRNIRFALRRLLERLGTLPRVELEAAVIQELCGQYRRMAICSVLLEADMELFFALLRKSAQAYLALLKQIDWGEIVDRYYLCASRAQPFFDALAGDDFDTALSMVPLSLGVWAEEDEYEDDFLYMKFLMDVLREGANSPSLAGTLARFRQVVGEPERARLELCEAMMAGDTQKFEMALADLLLERKRELARERASPGADPEMLRTEAHLFIEGAALMRLASFLGLHIPFRDRPGIPAWVLTKPKNPPPGPLAWREPP